MTNPAQLREALNNLTPMERRVYDAVPIQEAWQIHQICSETMRSGPRVQLNIVGGILDTMKRQKLVIEAATGRFWRNPIPEKPMPEPKLAPKSESAKRTVADQLGDVAAQLRKAADMLDEVAMVAMQEIEAVQAEHAKLKNIKAALAALGSIE